MTVDEIKAWLRDEMRRASQGVRFLALRDALERLDEPSGFDDMMATKRAAEQKIRRDFHARYGDYQRCPKCGTNEYLPPCTCGAPMVSAGYTAPPVKSYG